MNPTHFQEGQISFDDMCALLQEVAAFGPDLLTLRVVAARDQNARWFSFASILNNDSVSPDSQPVIRIGSVALISVCRQARDIKRADDLHAFLVSWEKLLDGQSVVPGFADQIQLERVGGYSGFGPYPCWQGTLQEVYKDRPPFMTLRGPFLSPEFGIFKNTIGGLAAAWTGMRGYESVVQPRDQMYSVIRDPRAHFSSGQRSGLQIEIEVTVIPASQNELYCGVSAKDFDGMSHSLFVPVKEGSAIFTLPTSCREIEVFLLNSEGYWFDRLVENEYFCNTPFSLLGLSHRSRDARSEDLLKALERGEGEHIEFKKWIPPERNDEKTYELLKTACAFANTDGGVLYIGVTDDLEICGTNKELHRWKPKMKPAELRALYANEISRLIDQSISPPIRINVEWVSHAGLHVLRVDVPASMGTNHYIVESNQTYVRRGANCKLATPQDIQALGNSSRSFGRL